MTVIKTHITGARFVRHLDRHSSGLRVQKWGPEIQRETKILHAVDRRGVQPIENF